MRASARVEWDSAVATVTADPRYRASQWLRRRALPNLPSGQQAA